MAARAESTLDWDSVVKAVADQDPQLQSALREEKAYQDLYSSSYSTWYPQLQAYGKHLGQDSQNRLNILDSNSPIVVTEQHEDVYGVQSTFNLFQGFGSLAHTNAALEGYETVRADRQATETDILSSVRTAYGQILILQKQIAFFKRTSDRLKLFAALLKVKYQGGTEAKWSVDQALADAEEADLEVERRQADIQTQKEALALRMQSSPQFEVAPMTYPTLEELKRRAPTQHPQLHKLDATMRQIDYQRKELDAAFWPHIDVSYKYEKIRPEGESWLDNHGWMISATWDIFTGLSSVYDTRAQVEKKRAAEIDLQRQRQTIVNSQAQYSRAYEISNRLLKSKAKQLAVARTRIDVVESQFRSGRRTFSEWEQAETYLNNTELDLISVEADLISDLAKLENALGIGLLP